VVVTVVTNIVLIVTAGVFSRFERHPTISATETSSAMYTFFALFMNQALVPVVLYSLVEVGAT